MLRIRTPRLPAPVGVFAQGSPTLGDLIAAAVGHRGATGSGSPVLGDLVAAGTGGMQWSGDGATAIGDFVVTAFGLGVPQDGAASCALDGDFVCAATGARWVVSTGDAVLDGPFGTEAFATWDPPTMGGSAAVALDPLVAAAVGLIRPAGRGTATIDGDLQVAATGRVPLFGFSAALLGQFALATQGFVDVAGSGDAVIGPMFGTATAFVPEPVVGMGTALLTPAAGTNPCFATGWAYATGTHNGPVSGLNAGALFAPDGQIRSVATGAFVERRRGWNDGAGMPDFVVAATGHSVVRLDPDDNVPMAIAPGTISANASGIAVTVITGTGVGVAMGAQPPPGGLIVGTAAGFAAVVLSGGPTLDSLVGVAIGRCLVRGVSGSFSPSVPIVLDNFTPQAFGVYANAIYIDGNATYAGAATITAAASGTTWVRGVSANALVPGPTTLSGDFGVPATPRNSLTHVQPVLGQGICVFPFEPAPRDMWQIRYIALAGAPSFKGGETVVGSLTGSRGVVYSDFRLGSTGRLLLYDTQQGKYTYPANIFPTVVPFILGDRLRVRTAIGAFEDRADVTTAESGGFPTAGSVQTQQGVARTIDFGEQTVMSASSSGIALVTSDPVVPSSAVLDDAVVPLGMAAVGARGNAGFMYDTTVNVLNLGPLIAASVGYTFVGVGTATIYVDPFDGFYSRGQGRWDTRPPIEGEGRATLAAPTGAAVGFSVVAGTGDDTLDIPTAQATGVALVVGEGQASVVGQLIGGGTADFIHPLDIGCARCVVAGAPAFMTGVFTFHFETSCIKVEPNLGPTETYEVSVSEIYDACQLAQASEQGIVFGQIARASGLTALTPDVQVALTVELLGNWHICFQDGLYQAKIVGGNLTGGELGGPIAFSPTTQIILVQAASAMVVTGRAPTADAIATAVWAKELPLP